ncbi:O-antigen-like protein [Rhodopirellula maiorica SM1]|uniref:O-antigen-like protein n=1 Tax=Rhodopirellula maiorica SM1 TaxID=1265738 RepID=M5RKE9_9BACT|nr:GDSL-type esterase/lipase family protein [Rhodopirellula maiorica]EMI15837.1 O-antigen-like protein [Rhodopirellula maiorica SM1]
MKRRFTAYRCLILVALSLIVSSGIAADHVAYRGNFQNARIKFEQAKTGNVAFIGGSITEMNGYRPMVCEILERRFPETKFNFINAGISSTCSNTGAFRLQSDVLDRGDIDLLFVEFAVNDDQDAHHSRAACIRGMEGLVRHARIANPNIDLVITFFVNESMLANLQKGETPLTIASHTAVAEHYNVSTIGLASEVADRITAGTLTWKQYGGVHPAPAGNAIAASMIDALMSKAWDTPLSSDVALQSHPLPASPLDPASYWRGRFVDPATAEIQNGWTLAVPDWSLLPGSTRERFREIPMLCGEHAGDTVSLSFVGTAIGAYVVAGPDAGMIKASLDGGPFQVVDLYHHHSKGLHYPRTVMFATDLKAGEHTVELKIAAETRSKGNAARIIQFVAN